MARKDFKEIKLGDLILLSTSEVASRLQVSKPTILALIKEGKIPAQKVGGKFFIPEEGVKEFFRRGESKPRTKKR